MELKFRRALCGVVTAMAAVLAKEVERWNKIVLLLGFADALR
jgi:hypothetical protein